MSRDCSQQDDQTENDRQRIRTKPARTAQQASRLLDGPHSPITIRWLLQHGNAPSFRKPLANTVSPLGKMQTRHSDLPVHESIVADSRCGRVGKGTEVVSTGGSYEINELHSSRPLRLRDLP